MNAQDGACANPPVVPVPVGTQRVEMKKFTDNAFGFSVDIPKDWVTHEEMIIVLVAAPPSTKEWYEPSVKFAVMNNKPDMNAKDLAEAATRQNAGIWKVRSGRSVNVGGLAGWQLELDQTVVGKSARIIKTFLIGKEKYIIVSSYSPAAKAEEYKDLFAQILNSLVFKK